jgi:uncharacterized protein YnzC (UPF0291/DUF896 family)
MTEITKIKRQLKIQGVLITFLTIVALISLYYNIRKTDYTENVITTKGIRIIDEHGNDRILIGAPIPLSESRIRDDYKKVEKAYGDWFPPEANFLSIFKNQVNNSMNGILILDKKGYDKLSFGDPVPDLFMGKRVGPSTGVAINDSVGVERSGYGLIKFPDRYRVTLGFDREDGLEGMIFGLDDNGNTEFQLRSSDLNESITIGKNNNEDEFGLHYKNRKDSLSKKINFNK